MRDAQISGNLFDFPAALNERHGIFLELAVISPRIPALHFFHFRVFLLQSPSRVFEAGQKVAWINGGITLKDKESHGLMSSLSDIQIQTLRYAADGLTNAEIGRLRFVSEKAIEQVLSRVAIALNIQPDHRKNMRVQLINEYLKWIGAPTH